MPPRPDSAAATTLQAQYSPEERQLLLELAHRAIAARLAGTRLAVEPPTAHLAERRGVFTTLELRGQLRGCVGVIGAQYPLYEAVAGTAISAAFEDPRFLPVTADEAPHLQVSISVLSPLKEIPAEEVVVGCHGLLISYGLQRGLLLPQVAEEHGWDAQTFLAQTCLKAGLAPDQWKRGARIQGFTAEVFGE
jgi:AmmeMemoRadiSam system protein A